MRKVNGTWQLLNDQIGLTYLGIFALLCSHCRCCLVCAMCSCLFCLVVLFYEWFLTDIKWDLMSTFEWICFALLLMSRLVRVLSVWYLLVCFWFVWLRDDSNCNEMMNLPHVGIKKTNGFIAFCSVMYLFQFCSLFDAVVSFWWFMTCVEWDLDSKFFFFSLIGKAYGLIYFATFLSFLN